MKILFFLLKFPTEKVILLQTVQSVFYNFQVGHEGIKTHSKILKIAKKMIKIMKILFLKSKLSKDRVVLAWDSYYSQYYIFRGRS